MTAPFNLTEALAASRGIAKVGAARWAEGVRLAAANLPYPLDLMHPQARAILEREAGEYVATLTLDEQVAILRAHVAPGQLYEDQK